MRFLGPDHEHARSLRATLILGYVQVGRPDDAMTFHARYQHLKDPADSGPD
jgi:hypothetical protein